MLVHRFIKLKTVGICSTLLNYLIKNKWCFVRNFSIFILLILFKINDQRLQKSDNRVRFVENIND